MERSWANVRSILRWFLLQNLFSAYAEYSKMHYGNTQSLLGEYGEAYSEYRTMDIEPVFANILLKNQILKST